MKMTSKKFTAWHAVAIYFLANGISWTSAGLVGDFEFYNSFVQPSVAPPDWLFAPMWFFLNVTSLVALYRVANVQMSEGKARKQFLWSEGTFWVLFATFALMYFGLKSPILASANTVTVLLVTLISLYYAYRLDRRAFYLIVPRLLWALLASYVSLFMAINNHDVFFNL